MKKEEVIEIVESMGFRLDYDQWDIKDKGWVRFVLNDDLDEKDLRWIWYEEDSLSENFSRGAKILFTAGQKAKIQQMNKFVQLK